MQKHLLLFVAVLLFFAACRKTKEQPSPPPVDKEYEIITTASLYNPANNHYEPACWTNDKRIILEMGTADQVFPYGIEKVGTDVYISGGFAHSDPSMGSDLLMPCYWKNAQKIDLPVTGLTIDQRAAAGDVRWCNNALYFLGDADLLPVLWKVENGSTSIIPVSWADDIIGVRKTGNLQVYDNKLYFGGNQKKVHNGQIVFTSGYWTVDAADKISFTVLEDNLPYALSFNISVTSKGVFVAGEYSPTATANATPVIWSATGHLPVSASFDAAIHRLHTCVTDAQGNIYLNVFDIKSYQPVIWKVPGNGPHQLIRPVVPANAKGFCETLDINDDKLAYAYTYELNGKSYGAYAFEGKTVELDIYANRLSNLHRMRIFPK